MVSREIISTHSLAYAGVVPFVAAILLPVVFRTHFIGFADAQLGPIVFISYSVLIASFMTGTLWGRLKGSALVSDFADMKSQQQVLLVSNILCLIAWLAGILAFMGLLTISFIILIIVHMATFLYEQRHWRVQASSSCDHYLRLRARVTYLVVALHLIACTSFSVFLV